MKYLQIHNTTNNEPKILEIGVDFDTIIQNYYFGVDTGTVKNDKMYLSLARRSSPEDFDTVAFIIDCYQSRPLIEIDGFCEFDVIRFQKDIFGNEITILFLPYFNLQRLYFAGGQGTYADCGKKTSEGSIFTQENKIKYPELYNEALKIINKN